MSSNDPIVKGFNNGYLFGKYQPELADKLSKGFKERGGDYGLGFREGVKQFKQEKSNTKLKNYDIKTLKKRENKPKDRELGDRDI